jgi:hypothetical protein
MIFLQGSGGVTWPFDAESVTDSRLPEYVRYQIKKGDLHEVPPPEGYTEEGDMARPPDTATKAVWASYIRTFDVALSEAEVQSTSRKELIAWADELENSAG